MANSNVRIEWNLDGFKQLRLDPSVVADLERRGQAILDACGGEAEGYGMVSHQGAAHPEGRWQIEVGTVTPEAMVENARENTLIRNLGAAHG